MKKKRLNGSQAKNNGHSRSWYFEGNDLRSGFGNLTSYEGLYVHFNIAIQVLVAYGRLFGIENHALFSIKYLESIPAVPVATLLEHGLGLLDVGGDELVVGVEEADADAVEEAVHAVAHAHGLLQGAVDRRQGRGLVPDLRRNKKQVGNLRMKPKLNRTGEIDSNKGL